LHCRHFVRLALRVCVSVCVRVCVRVYVCVCVFEREYMLLCTRGKGGKV
jgi:hypothetical protein